MIEEYEIIDENELPENEDFCGYSKEDEDENGVCLLWD